MEFKQYILGYPACGACHRPLRGYSDDYCDDNCIEMKCLIQKERHKERHMEYKPNKWYVNIIESEAGWGQKVDDCLEFNTYEEAAKYVKEYNEKYNPPVKTVPDWYMYAAKPFQKQW